MHPSSGCSFSVSSRKFSCLGSRYMTGNNRSNIFGCSSDGFSVPTRDAMGLPSGLCEGQNLGPAKSWSSSYKAGIVAEIISRSRRAKRQVSAASLTMRFTAILIASSSLGSAKCLMALTISSTTVPAAVLMRCLAPLLVNAARRVC